MYPKVNNAFVECFFLHGASSRFIILIVQLKVLFIEVLEIFWCTFRPSISFVTSVRKKMPDLLIYRIWHAFYLLSGNQSNLTKHARNAKRHAERKHKTEWKKQTSMRMFGWWPDGLMNAFWTYFCVMNSFRWSLEKRKSNDLKWLRLEFYPYLKDNLFILGKSSRSSPYDHLHITTSGRFEGRIQACFHNFVEITVPYCSGKLRKIENPNYIPSPIICISPFSKICNVLKANPG